MNHSWGDLTDVSAKTKVPFITDRQQPITDESPLLPVPFVNLSLFAIKITGVSG